jgi:BirA family biotin operon repressor/biotin-[acetyl-CoA-carboxylase] ligase
MNIPLLYRLRDANGAFVPMAELGEDRGAVLTDLDELEAFGHLVERHPYYGVAYRAPAERLCPDQIEYALETQRVGRRIAVWNRVASTNDLAARAAGSTANEGLVVLAEEQWAGRGRRGRRWAAPPRSSLLMSILLYPPAHLGATPWLTALGAVATAEVVAEATGLDVRIKWPNDVRVDGRKVAGILVERGAGAVIGIGLNVNIPPGPQGFPEDLARLATSLQILCGEPLDRSELARSLIRRLDHWYDQGLTGGAETLSSPWRTRSEHLGQEVRVTTPAGSFTGRLADLDLGRGVVLAAGDGVSHLIETRDVLELVPYGSSIDD